MGLDISLFGEAEASDVDGLLDPTGPTGYHTSGFVGLFDMDGHLVGINTFKTAGRSSAFFFSLPIEWLAILEKQPIETYKTSPIKLYATDILKAIRFEAQIVTLAAIELKNGKPLQKFDHDRLLIAMERINTGLSQL